MLTAILIACSHFGLVPAYDTLLTVWQDDGQIQSTAFILSEQWCNHARTFCYDENGYGCQTDECTSVWTVYAQAPNTYTYGTIGLPIGYWVVDPLGHNEQGRWAGPGDWNMDGATDSSDLFRFLDDFFAGNADQDLSGSTDSNDFFLFLTDFMGN